MPFEHARLLRAQRELVTLAPARLDAREQRVVEADLVPVCGQLGRNLTLDLEQGVVAVCARERVNRDETRVSARPLRSSATIVLSKLGGRGLAVMASISAK